jgi:hypothetical protein
MPAYSVRVAQRVSMWQQIEQRRRLAKSAMAKLVANDEGRNRLILFCRWLRHWNFYLRQFYDLVLRCLLWRSSTVENSFWQGSVEDEIQTISWICHRLVR